LDSYWPPEEVESRISLIELSSSLWRSIIDCAPADVRDPNASNLDDPAFHLHRLSARSGEAIADQMGDHIDVKPVREQRRSSAAARSSEHLERTALVLTKRHRSSQCRQPGVEHRLAAVAPFMS
jgi:hypothetical protein